jgi:peptidoglycan/LPS O-acetylase OafA/YrhL
MQEGMPVTTSMALGLGVVVGGTAAIYVCAWVSYRFFEQPFLRLKGKFHG